MQAAFKAPNPAQIKEVPGLYISDIIVPSSPTQLRESGITHVLSILAAPTRAPTIPKALGVVHKVIELEDDPFADLLAILNPACKFLDDALSSSQKSGVEIKAEEEQGDGQERKVLVHCLQGISRSGSLVIAYIMKRLNMPYEAALEIVQYARPIVLPNEGFVEQLKLWGEMGYRIVNEEGEEKGVYTEWKNRRDKMMTMGEEVVNRERVRGVVGLVARMGRRRLEIDSEKKLKIDV